MYANRERELLEALREDILLHLQDPGTALKAIQSEADGRFTFKYTTQNGGGCVSVEAPVHRTAVRRYPVPDGLDDVELAIALEETWTRPPSETQWWMAAVD